MLLERITLENFRAYRGRQTIDLRPAGRDKPIVLVTGLNGTGKTTLLEALHLDISGALGLESLPSEQRHETLNRVLEVVNKRLERRVVSFPLLPPRASERGRASAAEVGSAPPDRSPS